MRLGVYVGSFNPPHVGHKRAMDYLLANKFLDKIVVVATKNYWDKNNLINVKERINMLKYYGNENIIIDDKRNDFSYTYLVLNDIKKEYPFDDIYLIIGADNLENFNKWQNIHEILKYKVIVLPRGACNIEKYINEFSEKDNFIVVNNFKNMDISSTKIRNDIKNKNIEEIKKYMHPDILKYLLLNNLY